MALVTVKFRHRSVNGADRTTSAASGQKRKQHSKIVSDVLEPTIKIYWFGNKRKW